jgi:hypothetical protein
MENRPKDRLHKNLEKPPARVVNMKLPLDLVDAIEQMSEDLDRNFHNTITISLLWAVWAHSHGRTPAREIFDAPGPPGFDKWDVRIRARREIRELTHLYEISREERTEGAHGS